MSAWKARFAAGVAALFLYAGAPAFAQVPDPYARTLAQQLTRAELASEQGYMRAAGPFPGGMEQSGIVRIPLTLRVGQEYRLVGVCADRCEVNLRVNDPNSAALARAEIEAGANVLYVRPAFTGVHEVEIEMTHCAAATCWYALNVYSR